jgi:hypothetical protein
VDYDPGVQAQASALHMAAIDRELPREVAKASEAVSVVVGLVDFARLGPFEDEPNTLASWLCLRRAVEQLRVAFFSAYVGHYSEVPLLVRGAYESAGLARQLALDPDAADRWVQEGTWHPDREVRKWLRENGGDAEVSRNFYGHVSDVAHTTWASTAPFLPEIADRSLPLCVNPFDLEHARQSLVGVLGAGLLVAYCARNAYADETVLPIGLRRRVIALHAAAGGETAQLEQDWDEVARRQEQLKDSVNRASGLDDRLAANPLSITNLKGPDTDSA